MSLARAPKLDTKEQVAVLCEVSDLLFHTIHDPQRAIEICWHALSVDEDSREALHRLSVLYTKTEKWRDAIKTILQMANLEPGAVRRARYLQAAGSIACEQDQQVGNPAANNLQRDLPFSSRI